MKKTRILKKNYEFKKVLSNKTKVVVLTHVSNVMGYITPIKEIINLAHEVGAVVVVDAAQSVPHMKVDVKELDCDFLAFSAHKMFGPTGFGVLYGKYKYLKAMRPVEFGGDMDMTFGTLTDQYIESQKNKVRKRTMDTYLKRRKYFSNFENVKLKDLDGTLYHKFLYSAVLLVKQSHVIWP